MFSKDSDNRRLKSLEDRATKLEKNLKRLLQEKKREVHITLHEGDKTDKKVKNFYDNQMALNRQIIGNYNDLINNYGKILNVYFDTDIMMFQAKISNKNNFKKCLQYMLKLENLISDANKNNVYNNQYTNELKTQLYDIIKDMFATLDTKSVEKAFDLQDFSKLNTVIGPDLMLLLRKAGVNLENLKHQQSSKEISELQKPTEKNTTDPEMQTYNPEKHTIMNNKIAQQDTKTFSEAYPELRLEETALKEGWLDYMIPEREIILALRAMEGGSPRRVVRGSRGLPSRTELPESERLKASEERDGKLSSASSHLRAGPECALVHEGDGDEDVRGSLGSHVCESISGKDDRNLSRASDSTEEFKPHEPLELEQFLKEPSNTPQPSKPNSELKNKDLRAEKLSSQNNSSDDSPVSALVETKIDSDNAKEVTENRSRSNSLSSSSNRQSAASAISELMDDIARSFRSFPQVVISNFSRLFGLNTEQPSSNIESKPNSVAPVAKPPVMKSEQNEKRVVDSFKTSKNLTDMSKPTQAEALITMQKKALYDNDSPTEKPITSDILLANPIFS